MVVEGVDSANRRAAIERRDGPRCRGRTDRRLVLLFRNPEAQLSEWFQCHSLLGTRRGCCRCHGLQRLGWNRHNDWARSYAKVRGHSFTRAAAADCCPEGDRLAAIRLWQAHGLEMPIRQHYQDLDSGQEPTFGKGRVKSRLRNGGGRRARVACRARDNGWGPGGTGVARANRTSGRVW